MKKILLIIAGLLSLSAYADSTTGIEKSTATLAAKCELSVDDINIGVLTVGQPNWATGQVRVMCSKSTAYSIYIHYPYYPTASHLTGVNHGATISYGIKNEQKGVFFESAGAYTYPFTGTGNGLIQTYNMTAYIGSTGYPIPDVYKDTLNVQVNY